MKVILSVFVLVIFNAALYAQNPNTIEIKAVPKQWTITNNYSKSDNGQLLINTPEQTVLSCIVSKVGEAKTFALRSGNPKEVKPGLYDVSFWGIKIPQVTVETGKDTRIFAGFLKSTVKGLWELWTADGQKIYSAGGPKQIALPVGNYIVKTGGTEIKTTITDGKVSLFNYTGY